MRQADNFVGLVHRSDGVRNLKGAGNQRRYLPQYPVSCLIRRSFTTPAMNLFFRSSCPAGAWGLPEFHVGHRLSVRRIGKRQLCAVRGLGGGHLCAHDVPRHPAAERDGGRRSRGASNHSASVKADGTLWTVGRNQCGQMGDGTPTTRSTPVQVISGAVGARATGQRRGTLADLPVAEGRHAVSELAGGSIRSDAANITARWTQGKSFYDTTFFGCYRIIDD